MVFLYLDLDYGEISDFRIRIQNNQPVDSMDFPMHDAMFIDKGLASLVTRCASCVRCSEVFLLKDNQLLIHCQRGYFQQKENLITDMAEKCPIFIDAHKKKKILAEIIEVVE